MKAQLKEKLSKIKIIFMDIDGVLNDGRVVFHGGESPKTWYVRDRLGMMIMKRRKDPDIKLVWISGRQSSELETRAQELGVDDVFSDVEDKLKIMKEVLSGYGLEFSDAMYIGDDIIDIGCMEKAGVSCCPRDAAEDIREMADYVSTCDGGRGAVREIIEEILRARGEWKEIVESFKET
ncbi:MAG: HAD hydrolase family protein [Elusimicrobiota bacterium]